MDCRCPACNQRYQVDSKFAGKQLKCKKCGAIFKAVSALSPAIADDSDYRVADLIEDVSSGQPKRAIIARMESAYQSPAPIPSDSPRSVAKKESFLSWWGVFPVIAFFAVAAVYAWPQARAEQKDLGSAVGFFVGQLMGGVLVAAVIAWIVYRMAGRSRTPSTIVFTIVTMFISLSVIHEAAMKNANVSQAPAAISLEDFSIEIPRGWQSGKSDRERTQVLLLHPAGTAIDGMIQVDVGKPVRPTAMETAQSLAGTDGKVSPDAVLLDGVAGLRVETPSADLSRPRLAVVLHRNAKAYLVMAAATNGNDVSAALEHVVASWRWLNKQ